MPSSAGLFFTISLLVVVAGAVKAVRPATTTRALDEVGLRLPPLAVRVGGLVEVAVGGSALATGGWAPALLVAVSYGLFATFVAVALRRGTPLSSCGCFGRDDTPPTVGHLLFNIGAAGVAAAFALGSPTDVMARLSNEPGAGVPFVLLVVVAAGLAGLALTELPRTLASGRPRRES
jgi:hypothetical protein